MTALVCFPFLLEGSAWWARRQQKGVMLSALSASCLRCSYPTSGVGYLLPITRLSNVIFSDKYKNYGLERGSDFPGITQQLQEKTELKPRFPGGWACSLHSNPIVWKVGRGRHLFWTAFNSSPLPTDPQGICSNRLWLSFSYVSHSVVSDSLWHHEL